MLAPPGWKTVLSYLVGWLTTLAWVATVATETLFAGTVIQGVIALDYPNYVSKQWQGTLLTWLVILVCIFINVVIPNQLPRFEVFMVGLHLVGFVAIVATLWATTSQFSSNSTVWATSLNTGGWPTQGLSYCVGFLGNLATFVGADASVHMAEEVSNASKNIPRAITGAMLINGLVGFIMMITALYCLGDLDKIEHTRTGFPFLQIFADSTKNIAGATVMAAVVLILTWTCATGILTTASRMTWSFARDNGLPGSKWLSKVGKHNRVPVNAVIVVSVISALLTLIYIGSITAFNDVISLTITGFYGSYLLPCSLLLYHRIKGHVLPYGTATGDIGASSTSQEIKTDTSDNLPVTDDKLKGEIGDTAPNAGTDVSRGTILSEVPLIWGPWHIKGIIGTINNAYACVYMVFVIFWSVWPADYKPTVAEMNYSIVVTGGVLILSGVWYFVRARKVYKGPTVDDEVIAAVVRSGSVVSIRG